MPDGSNILTGGFGNATAGTICKSTDNGENGQQINGEFCWNAGYAISTSIISNGGLILTGGKVHKFINDTWIFNPVGSSMQNATHTYSVLQVV